MAEVLQQNDTLVLLDLSINCVDDEAVRLLCQGLATNETLEVLKVSKRLLQQYFIVTILTSLHPMNFRSCLVFACALQLSHNPITKIGAATLLRTVKNNMKSALEEIDISVSAAKEYKLRCK